MGERSKEASRRVTFEIDDDDGQLQHLMIVGATAAPASKSVGARLILYLSFISTTILLCGIILYLSGDLMAKEVTDTKIRDPSLLTKPNSTRLPAALGAELLKSMQNGSLSQQDKLRLFQMPDSNDRRVLSLYSSDTRKKLIDKLQGTKKKHFTILANGGSTTAAAGHILNDELFFVRLARYLESMYDIPEVTVANMGHGARDSFHSFLMAESFFSNNKNNATVDLIVWEFSMNDRLIGGTVEQRNLLIFWLSKVAQFYAPNPPPVVLVYYWTSPLSSNKDDGRVQSDVFYAHDSLGADFDFVLGHVHMGAFVDNLGWEQDAYRQIFLAEQDDHHPNALGHALTTMLMQQLISDGSILPLDRAKAEPQLEWVCATGTEEQKLLKGVLFDESLKSKASFIADTPKNDPNLSDGVLEPTYRPNSDTGGDYFWNEVSYGMASDWRSDRHKGVQLPNCDADGRLVLDVREHVPLRAVHFLVMNGAKGQITDKKADEWHDRRHLGLFAQGGIAIGVMLLQTLRIWVGDVDYTERIIDAVEWECHLSKPMYRRWLVLDDHANQNVTRIELCDGGPANASTALTLEHLAIFYCQNIPSHIITSLTLTLKFLSMKTYLESVVLPFLIRRMMIIDPYWIALLAMRGYIGIDNGTQGLSVVLTDEHLKVMATGEGTYPMVGGLKEGEYEQRAQDWDSALIQAMNQVNEQYPQKEILGIGISGQMHGEVLVDEDGNPIGNVRLWCDSRNEKEGKELTALFGTKVAKRSTCSRFLWTVRNRPETARKTRHLTTPAGWIHYRLTGQWNLGIGDASGMFPIDQDTLDYDEELLTKFDELINDDSIESMKSILPKVYRAGQDAGSVDVTGAEIFGLSLGIPVAAAEGDQPAALAGSLIAEAGLVSMSYGTSIVSNAVGDRPFSGVSDGVDHFCAADGKPINMIWIRNGTTYLNLMVKMFGKVMEDESEAFAKVMPQLLAASPDCGGLMALPFMDDEPGVGVSQGGTALMLGWSRENATVGNVAKAALLGSIFNLKLGTGVLDEQGYPRTEIVLTGGLTKTPECAQIVADVFDMPVEILDSGEEGSAWGAAVLAKYRHDRSCMIFTEFCEDLQKQLSTTQRFEPDPEAVQEYAKVFLRYKKLMSIQPMLNEVMH